MASPNSRRVAAFGCRKSSENVTRPGTTEGAFGTTVNMPTVNRTMSSASHIASWSALTIATAERARRAACCAMLCRRDFLRPRLQLGMSALPCIQLQLHCLASALATIIPCSIMQFSRNPADLHRAFGAEDSLGTEDFTFRFQRSIPFLSRM